MSVFLSKGIDITLILSSFKSQMICRSYLKYEICVEWAKAKYLNKKCNVTGIWYFLFRNIQNVCLLVNGDSSLSRMFHSYGGHHYRWRTVIFGLCSALMVIEQWRLFSVSHLLRYDYLLEPLNLTPVAECYALELLLPVEPI